MGRIARGRLIVVGKKRDPHNLGVAGFTQRKLWHVGEIDGGRVVDVFERAGGVEMTGWVSTAADIVSRYLMIAIQESGLTLLQPPALGAIALLQAHS